MRKIVLLLMLLMMGCVPQSQLSAMMEQYNLIQMHQLLYGTKIELPPGTKVDYYVPPPPAIIYNEVPLALPPIYSYGGLK